MMHAVEVEADSPPVFPDRCVVCAKHQPGDGAQMTALFNGMKPLEDELFKLHRATIPVCGGCKSTLHRSRWLGKLVFAAAIVVSVVLILGMLELPGAWLEGWVGYAVLAAAGLGPFIVAMLVYTPYFDFSPWDRRVIYEFRDADYAKRFAELSGGEAV